MIKVKHTYVTDRGVEVELSHMEDSFVINEIAHHTDQISALEAMTAMPIPPYIDEKLKIIRETRRLLYEELSSRTHDPAKRAERRYSRDMEHQF